MSPVNPLDIKGFTSFPLLSFIVYDSIMTHFYVLYQHYPHSYPQFWAFPPIFFRFQPLTPCVKIVLSGYGCPLEKKLVSCFWCAGTENRTPISSLARTHSTIKPYPQIFYQYTDFLSFWKRVRPELLESCVLFPPYSYYLNQKWHAWGCITLVHLVRCVKHSLWDMWFP